MKDNQVRASGRNRSGRIVAPSVGSRSTSRVRVTAGLPCSPERSPATTAATATGSEIGTAAIRPAQAHVRASKALAIAETIPVRVARDGKAGRHPLFNRARATKIVAALREGQYLETACKLAGVSTACVADWRAKGESKPDSPYGRFVSACDEAEAEAEAFAVRGVLNAGEKDWKAYAAWLGRRHRAKWSEQPIAGESNRTAVQINVGLALPGTSDRLQVIDSQVLAVPELSDD